MKYFAGYHGKSIVGRAFGRLYMISRLLTLSMASIQQAFKVLSLENISKKIIRIVVSLEPITEKMSPEPLKYIKINNINHYLSYKFLKVQGFYSYLASNDIYVLFEDG